jgi:hypothetical protein
MASDGILLCESYRRRRSNTPAVIASFAQEPWFCSGRSVLVTSDDLAEVRRRIERAVADGAPEQLKRLLDSVVEQIGSSPGPASSLLRRAGGSYAYRFAEADGNRTRLSRVAAHTGFED